tara:strand:- start:870 stop:1733 length:864 start_codon:yes stop_codon:yes gene_type:complete
MREKTVSIIIPTFNRLYTLKTVLDSYFQQDYLKEIIIVDDGSTDGTYEFIHSLNNPLIVYCRHPQTLGVTTSRNTGIKKATGEFIAFGEDDLFFDSDYVSILLKNLVDYQADIIAGKLVYLKNDETFFQAKKRASNLKPYLNLWTLMANYQKEVDGGLEVPFFHACSLMKRSVADSLLYDTSFKMPALREETDFYLRAYETGYKLLFVSETIVYHLPIDSIKTGGAWQSGLFHYHLQAIKNNYRFTKRHFKTLKKIGLKSGFFLFNFLHILNRVRILARTVYYQLKN